MRHRLAVCWAIAGVSLLLGSAIYRLAAHVEPLFYHTFSISEVLAMTFWIVFMAYSEGYRGFQRNFSPRVAARIRHLRHHGKGMQMLLAPFFCLGYFGTTRRRQITVVVLTAGLVLLILLMKNVPQPVRGIVDIGVIVGLGWGLLSFYYYTFLALTQGTFHFSAELTD